MEKKTNQQLWDQANEIRCNQIGETARPLKYATWKSTFNQSLKRAESPEIWMEIWEMFWTHPAYKWWRTTPEQPHSAFFRAKNWAMFEDAYDEMKHKGILKQDMETSTARVNTDTPGMAKTFWRTNQLEAGKAMRESKFDAWLDAAASNPDMVREVVGLRKRGEK